MLGLQLYTVRKRITDEKSALQVLDSIQKMGYECVQLAGDMETVALTAHAAMQVGIPVLGILVNMKTCEEEEDALFKIAHTCGAEDIGISSSMTTEEVAQDIIHRANRFAIKAKENGFSFSYHNHSNEFIRTEGGKTLMQLLMDGFDPQMIRWMPDTYWLQHGGVDVRDYLEKMGDRISMLHLKDMKRTAEGVTFAELGMGNLNFEGIVQTAKRIGVKHFIVEQDLCDGDPLDSARISCEYIRKFL